MSTNEKDAKNDGELPEDELESVSGGVYGDCIRNPKKPADDLVITIPEMPDPIIVIE